MLTYHPAFDLNHGMYRMLRLLHVIPEKQINWDSYRILDFYYLFPHLLDKVRLPQNLTKKKKQFVRLRSPYTHVPSPKQFLFQMEGIHEAISRALATRDFISMPQLDERIVARTARPLPDALLDSFELAESDRDLVDLLGKDLGVLPLSGQNGLKQRTGLLEHRYDAA